MTYVSYNCAVMSFCVRASVCACVRLCVREWVGKSEGAADVITHVLVSDLEFGAKKKLLDNSV